jgi:predicted component of type VI protein secretion system
VEIREGTIELGFWNLVFGVTAFSAEAPEPVNENRVEGFTVDYGLAPQQGITISGRFEQSKYLVDGLRAAIEEFNSVIVAVQW